MKTTEIFSLSLKEFEKELSLINLEYIIETYQSTIRALGRYKETVELSGENEYMGVNDYFNFDRNNNKEYNKFLEDLFKN